MARRWVGWAIAGAVLAAMVVIYLTDETERRGRLSPPPGPHPSGSGKTSGVGRSSSEADSAAVSPQEEAREAAGAPEVETF